MLQIRPTATASNASTYQTTPTPDANDQAVEPCVLYFPEGKYGYKYWMAMASYYQSDSSLENPSLLVTNDDPPNQTWIVPPGITNPIAAKPSSGNNCDQSLFVHPDGRLGVVWKVERTQPEAIWYLLYDGTTLGTATQLRTYPDTTTNRVVAPVIYPLDGTWHMWATEIASATIPQWPKVYHHYSAATLDGLGTATQEDCTVSELPHQTGHFLFESNVIRSSEGDLWLAVVTVSTPPLGGGCKLHLMSSTNGTDWLLDPTPVLTASAAGWDNGQVYRGSLVDAGGGGLYHLWYSAGGSSGWRIGYTTVTVA